MTCPLCVLDKPPDEFTDEHVFPESVGGSFTIRTCKSCNDRLGDGADAPLVNQWAVKARRAMLGIKGKSGRVPNPFERGVLRDDPTQKVHYQTNDDGSPKAVYVVPNITAERLEDDSERIRMVVDATDREQLSTMINKRLERQRHPQRVDSAEMDRALKVHTIVPQIRFDMAMDLLKYKRGVLKIAYELAAHWLGEDYVLHDSTAATLRACLWDFGDEWPTGHTVHGGIDFAAEMGFWSGEKNSHIAWLDRSRAAIACYVRVFDVIEGTIAVSFAPERYPMLVSQFLAIDPVTGNQRASSLVVEVARLGGMKPLGETSRD